ncbi:DUF917 family protein [Kineococcus sp. NPDC059986]|uniref:S-methyl thiohydantoin desulfurase domain-containing protein n=1 Tax=Kineococcus sp. NPDC059986 TaxID=3155538 RepID=UPI0034506B41
MELTAADVPALVRGAEVLGSGGGGDARAGGVLVSRLLRGGAVDLLDPAAVDPDLLVAAVGMVGATVVFTEQLPGGGEFARALAAAERWTGLRAGALASIEAAGLNAATALVTALAGAGPDGALPVVDLDLCGRALPRLDQFSLAVAGSDITPLALALPGGQVVVVDGGDAVTTERSVRSVLAGGGGWAALAVAPRPVRELLEHALAGTTRRVLDVGRRLLALPDAPAPAALARAADGEVLAAGRVLEVVRHRGAGGGFGGGFGRGSLVVRDRGTSTLLRLEMENEYLLALADGDLVATTPDVLAVLDRRAARPVSCDRVRRGDDVVVLRLDAPAFWRDPARLCAVGPRAFGYDVDPVLVDPVSAAEAHP